jgi:hypothetical protein
MAKVMAQEMVINYSLSKIVCPLDATSTYFIRRALEKTIGDVMGNNSLVGAFAVDWQDYSGRVVQRVACFDLEHNYDPEYSARDLREVVAGVINVAAAAHMGAALGWAKTDKLMYTVPDFLCHGGVCIPMSVNGTVVMTLLSTADIWQSRKIMEAVERDFLEKWQMA